MFGRNCYSVVTLIGLVLFHFPFSAPASASNFETVLMPGQVIEGHAKIEETCDRCHVRFDKSAQSQLCLDCHKDVSQDLRSKEGFHGRIREMGECKDCHTEHKGRNADIAPLNIEIFDHRQTDFLLKGSHSKVQCQACHLPRVKFRHAPSACFACHKKDDRHRGTLGTACANCHTEEIWKKVKFDHSKTRFPLHGKHSDVACDDCHKNQQFKGTPRTCNACHKKDDYHKGVFGTQCQQCHTEREWRITMFNHSRDTKYPLTGKHAKVTCESCHKVPVAKEPTPSTCYACHRQDDTHKGNFGSKCESCHDESDWKRILFLHDRDTKFPLRGKHNAAKCTACHTRHLYKDKLGTRCLACHKKDDTHKGQFGEQCQTCHIEQSWKTLIFDHNRDTKYPLRGKHQPLKCESCHTGHLYKKKLSSTCYTCHQKDDKHRGQEGRQCESCHNEHSWKETRFDHGSARFPLLGKHFVVACEKCHKTHAFKDAPMDCVACHDREDVHKRRLGPQCADCHNSRDWKLWDFDHNARTHFILDGAHQKSACLDCHVIPTETKVTLSQTCVSCHQFDDVHKGNFGHQCDRCHTTSSFADLQIELR